MFRRFILVLIVLIPTVVYAQQTRAVPSVPMGSITYLDARNGFRDLTFGQPKPETGVWQQVEVSGEQVFYTRANDDLTFGDGTADSIVYGFYKNRFLVVLIRTKGSQNSRALLKTFQSAYGMGKQHNPNIEQYIWGGSQVFAVYKQNPASHDAQASINSLPLFAELRDAEAAKAKRSASGL